MDQQSYEQINILNDLIGDDWKWLKDNMVVHVMFWNGRAIGVTLPNFVELRVTASEPGVKGDTSGGAQKPATLETGAIDQRAAVHQRGRPPAHRHAQRRVLRARQGLSLPPS